MKLPTATLFISALSVLPGASAWRLYFHDTVGNHELKTHGSGTSCYTISSSYYSRPTNKVFFDPDGNVHARVFPTDRCKGDVWWGVQEGTHAVSPPKVIHSYKIYDV
jgi:hypothetical protein